MKPRQNNLHRNSTVRSTPSHRRPTALASVYEEADWVARRILRLAKATGSIKPSPKPNERLASSIAILAIAKMVSKISLELADGPTQEKIAAIADAVAQGIYRERIVTLNASSHLFVSRTDGQVLGDSPWLTEKAFKRMDEVTASLMDSIRAILGHKPKGQVPIGELAGVAATARLCERVLNPKLFAAVDIRAKGYAGERVSQAAMQRRARELAQEDYADKYR